MAAAFLDFSAIWFVRGVGDGGLESLVLTAMPNTLLVLFFFFRFESGYGLRPRQQKETSSTWSVRL